MGGFIYEVGAKIEMAMSNEVGVVIGRAEYETGENNYYVRYRAADGCQRETWWGESAIKAV